MYADVGALAARAPHHAYHPLRVERVVHETADARSIVLGVPRDLSGAFSYGAGQFVTFRLEVAGETLFRSYSMSSTPTVDADLQITVKRVPGGRVSNWLVDNVRGGTVLDTSIPAGSFVLDDGGRDVVAFAAGSGITPIFSIVKYALHTTGRHIRLLYANRDTESTIFAAAIDALVVEFGDRLLVEHHLDVERGFVNSSDVEAFVANDHDRDVFVCGPAPFMDIVQAAVRSVGVTEAQLRIERFTPVEAAPSESANAEDGTEVTISLGGRRVTVPHRANTTILQTARSAGLRPPSSCEAGTCATCMARLLEGRVEMRNNEVLTPDEVADAWVLTCQAVPVSPVVRVVYE